MSEKIEPALSAEGWKSPAPDEIDGYVDLQLGIIDVTLAYRQPDKTIAALIALLNDALPDDDQRKITRKRVQAIRNAADRINWEWGDDGMDSAARELFAIADALESYLPPAPNDDTRTVS